MSALWPHARALRVLSEELRIEADMQPDLLSAESYVLLGLHFATKRAADRLDAEIQDGVAPTPEGEPSHANK